MLAGVNQCAGYLSPKHPLRPWQPRLLIPLYSILSIDGIRRLSVGFFDPLEVLLLVLDFVFDEPLGAKPQYQNKTWSKMDSLQCSSLKSGWMSELKTLNMPLRTLIARKYQKLPVFHTWCMTGGREEVRHSWPFPRLRRY